VTVTRQRWFLLGCAAVGVIVLIALLPPRAPQQSPDTNARPPNSNVPHSPSVTPTILPTDPVRGRSDAPLTIIEFGDLTCPSCVDAEQILTELQTMYGPQLRIVWKDFPILDRLTDSRRTHVAARCAQRHGQFWEYRSAALAEQPRDDPARIAIAGRLGLDAAVFTTCLEDAQTARLVGAGIAEAERLQLRAAPAFSVNGEWLEEHPTIDDFREIFDRVLR